MVCSDPFIEYVLALVPFEERQDYGHDLIADCLAHQVICESSHTDEGGPKLVCFGTRLLGLFNLFAGGEAVFDELVFELLVSEIADREHRGSGLEENCLDCLTSGQSQKSAALLLCYLAYEAWD